MFAAGNYHKLVKRPPANARREGRDVSGEQVIERQSV